MIPFRKIWQWLKPCLRTFWVEFIVRPFSLLGQPLNGFYELQRYNLGLVKVATFYLILESTLVILQFRYTGFLFNQFNVAEFNYIREVLLNAAPYLLFIAANWSITTLMDGKGKLKDIYNVVGYALFMKVLLSLVAILLSNVLTENEAFIYWGLQTVGYGIMLIMVFFGTMVVHEYTLTKTVFTMLFTVVSALVMMFVGLLGFSLLQQIYVFLVTIYREIVLRL